MPKIVVFLTQGGLGDCGQHAVVHALASDVSVLAVAQDRRAVGKIDDVKWKPAPFFTDDQWQHPSLRVVELPFAAANGDSADSADSAADRLRQTLCGAEAVIACPANRQGGKGAGSAAPAMRNICAAMQAEKVPRLVYLSTIGIDTPAFAWAWWARLGSLVAKCFKAWRAALKDFASADAIVRQSGLDYLIVRPMGLDANTFARQSWLEVQAQDTKTPLAGNIAKSDVGRYMLQEACAPSRHCDDIMLGQPRAKQRKQ